ncbi:MAG: PD-(D/E)XK nuclease family protein, partial [Calditrichia bacterium]
MARGHQSFSSMNLYDQCPAKYKFQYIDEIKTPSSLPLEGGSATHETLADFYNFKMKTGKDIPLSDFLAIFRYEFANHTAELEEVSQTVINNYQVKMEKCLTLYYADYAPKIMPKRVEFELTAKIAGTKILGKIDLLQTDNWIVDHKTTQKVPWGDVAAKSGQLSLYQWLCMKNNIETAGLRLDYIIAKKDPEILPLETERFLEDMVDIEDWMIGIID